MCWETYPYRIKSAAYLIGYKLRLGQDYSERAGPEFPGQHIGRGRNLLAVTGQPLGARQMEDQGVVLRTALCLEDPLHCCLIQTVGGKAVNRLRGNAGL